MIGIGGRLKTIREESGLSKINFAQAIGITTANTIYRWERELAFPPADILATINEKYSINIHWLTTGQGPMHEARSDARVESNVTFRPGDLRWETLSQGKDQPEAMLQDASRDLDSTNQSAQAQRPPGRKASSPTPQEEGEVMLESPDLDPNRTRPTEPPGFKIHDDVQIAIKVLESGTAYAVALHLNIQQFGKAVDEQAGMAKLRHTVNAQADTIHDLQQECHAMRKEVEELKAQLARLLSTGGTDPYHSQEVA